jgi:hypothetical protein
MTDYDDDELDFSEDDSEPSDDDEPLELESLDDEDDF